MNKLQKLNVNHKWFVMKVAFLAIIVIKIRICFKRVGIRITTAQMLHTRIRMCFMKAGYHTRVRTVALFMLKIKCHQVGYHTIVNRCFKIKIIMAIQICLTILLLHQFINIFKRLYLKQMAVYSLFFI